MAKGKNLAEEIGRDIKKDIVDVFSDSKKQKKSATAKKATLYMIFTAIILFIICTVLLITSLTIKTQAVKAAYADSKISASEKSYKKMEKKIFDIGEERYHTSNSVNINIGPLKEQSLLRILEVKDTHFYKSTTDKKTKSKAWYKVIGTGIFSVNMNLSEIITDEERNYILIKIPEPILQDNLEIEIERLHFESGLFEGIDKGIEIVQSAEKQGRAEIKEKLCANQEFFNCAKISAKEILIDIAKESNPDIDVTVEVEFF